MLYKNNKKQATKNKNVEDKELKENKKKQDIA